MSKQVSLLLGSTSLGEDNPSLSTDERHETSGLEI